MLTNFATTALGTAPNHTLRPVLFRLGQSGVLMRLHSRLLRALQNPVGGDLVELAILPQPGDSSSSSYALFRENITRQLFGSDVLLQLRLKLAITDFCWVRAFLLPRSLSCFPGLLSPYIRPYSIGAMQRSATSPEMQNEYGAVARGLLSVVSYRVLGALVRHIGTVGHLLTRKLSTTRPVLRLNCAAGIVQGMICHLCCGL